MWNSTYEGSTLDTVDPVIIQVPAFGPFVVSYALIAAVAALGTPEDPDAEEVVVVVVVVQTFEPAEAADDSFAFVFEP
jgi:hypothetical protein